jgi:protein subunit release factor A
MIIEIRAAEGGDDAKMLVEDQVTIYARVATRRGL